MCAGESLLENARYIRVNDLRQQRVLLDEPLDQISVIFLRHAYDLQHMWFVRLRRRSQKYLRHATFAYLSQQPVALYQNRGVCAHLVSYAEP